MIVERDPDLFLDKPEDPKAIFTIEFQAKTIIPPDDPESNPIQPEMQVEAYGTSGFVVRNERQSVEVDFDSPALKSMLEEMAANIRKENPTLDPNIVAIQATRETQRRFAAAKDYTIADQAYRELMAKGILHNKPIPIEELAQTGIGFCMEQTLLKFALLTHLGWDTQIAFLLPNDPKSGMPGHALILNPKHPQGKLVDICEVYGFDPRNYHVETIRLRPAA